MVKIEFWREEQGNLSLVRRYRKAGYEILCEPKGKINKSRKVCILFDPTISGNPARIYRWCEQIHPDSIICILMLKEEFFKRYPDQRFKLPVEVKK